MGVYRYILAFHAMEARGISRPAQWVFYTRRLSIRRRRQVQISKLMPDDYGTISRREKYALRV